MENNKKEVYKALVLAVNELKNPKNSADNSYFNSKYVPLSDILDLAKPVLMKYGLAIIQTPFVMYEHVPAKNGNTQEIGVVKVTTTLIHENGETLDFPPMVFKVQNTNPQAIGSVITYGRRYSLASILGISGKEEDDDGNYASIPNQINTESKQSGQQKSKQQERPKKQSKAETNINVTNVSAKIVAREEKVTANGTPYFMLKLANEEGKTISAMAKDQTAIAKVKNLNDGANATFKLLSMNGFFIVSDVNEIQATA